ncbi:MAG: MFS transporter [Gulosibacter sp.]|uniref:MFS transporter n=1 Tax=Gulosibacter sp. TaxID=2817531 RepID=UPI003F8E91AA
MAVSIARRRWSLYALFLIPGLALSSWVTRTPAIRDLLEASTAQMGLVLSGMSIGSTLGILSSGPLVSRFGARTITAIGLSGVVLSMPIIGVSGAMGSMWIAAVGLFFFGAGMGAAEVAINIEGADIEQVSKKSFLPSMHGCFSLGTVIGAVCGIIATAIGFSVIIHLIIVGVVTLILLIGGIRGVLPETGKALGRNVDSVAEPARPKVWKDPNLLLIGGIILSMALVEGTANDWLPLIMVDGHGFDETVGSLVFAMFAAAMTIGRLVGGKFVHRFGRAPVLFVSALSAVAGLAVVAFVDNQIAAATAVVLWGLGASLGFPVALSAAGDSGPDAAKRVTLVSIIGYIAFLVGPPLLGFVGEAIELRGALMIPLVLAAAAAVLSLVIWRRAKRSDEST